MFIVLSPYSRKLNGIKNNPKNYPWWERVISEINCSVVQIGRASETRLKGTCEFLEDLSFKDIENLITKSNLWVSVDNFLPHLANCINSSGVVIWGQSDPSIFGYSHNKNLLKSRGCLRQDQFAKWTGVEYKEDVFVSPTEVVKVIREVI